MTAAAAASHLFAACQEDLLFEDPHSETAALTLSDGGGGTDGGNLAVGQTPYLHFEDMKHYIDVRQDVENAVAAANSDDGGEGFAMPASYLAVKAESPGFTSYTEHMDHQQSIKLEAGWETLDALHGDYLTDKDEAYLLNEDGIVAIGDSVIMAGPLATYRAELDNFDELIATATNAPLSPPQDGPGSGGGVIINPRSNTPCTAAFSTDINHANRTVLVNWTGPDPNQSNYTSLTWNISGQTSNYANQTSFSVQFPNSGVTYQVCGTFRQIGTITTAILDSVRVDSNTVRIDTVGYTTRTGVVCSSTRCTDVTMGVCSVDFSSSEGIDGLYQFTSTASVPYGAITGYQWQFGDGQTSTQQNPTIQFPCDRDFTATLTVFSNDCPNGSASRSKEVSVSGFQCCDKNADSPWADSPSWSGGDRKISYRFDLGSEVVPWDQRIKAEMKHFEKNKKGKWKKEKANIQARFTGTLFAKDEDDCTCQNPVTISASPASSVNKKKETFKDKLDGLNSRDDWHKIKRDEPVVIEYLVDGTIRQTQNTGTGGGFECE